MSQPCRKCGYCCRALIVEAEALDVIREPRIARRAVLMDGHGKIKNVLDWAWSLVAGSACPFLMPNNMCEIYPTRPGRCVAFMPGEGRCRFPETVQTGIVRGDDEMAEELIRSIQEGPHA
jgi:Fe-S-cluster containining protein